MANLTNSLAASRTSRIGAFASKALRTFAAATLAIGMGFAAIAGIQTATCQEAFAKQKPYTYTVRVFSGEQGSFKANSSSADMLVATVKSGAQFGLDNIGAINVKDADKYYVKGWKYAGHDETNETLLGSFPVNRDVDLVVSYGVFVDKVGYTVRYVSSDGTELLPTQEFFGNVGDRPVLAYRYVEGFMPDAYNLTGELYSNASENVYTFVYTAVATPEEPTVVTPTVEVVPAADAGGEAAAPADAAAAAVAPDAAPAEAVENPPAEQLIADDGNPLAQPAEIKDIRDDETPMASATSLSTFDPTSDAEMLFSPTILGTTVSIAALLAAVAAIILFFMYRKKKHQEVTDSVHASIASHYPYASRNDADAYDQANGNGYVPLRNQSGYSQGANQTGYTQQYAGSQGVPNNANTYWQGDSNYGNAYGNQAGSGYPNGPDEQG